MATIGGPVYFMFLAPPPRPCWIRCCTCSLRSHEKLTSCGPHWSQMRPRSGVKKSFKAEEIHKIVTFDSNSTPRVSVMPRCAKMNRITVSTKMCGCFNPEHIKTANPGFKPWTSSEVPNRLWAANSYTIKTVFLKFEKWQVENKWTSEM